MVSMDGPTAVVVATTGRTASVSLPPVRCSRCLSGRGCGAGLLSVGGRERRVSVDLAPGLDVGAGDRVRLSQDGTAVLKAASLAYGAPLAGILLAAAIATAGGLSGGAALALAALGLAGGAGAGAFFARGRTGRAVAVALIGNDR